MGILVVGEGVGQNAFCVIRLGFNDRMVPSRCRLRFAKYIGLIMIAQTEPTIREVTIAMSRKAGRCQVDVEQQ